MKFRSNIQHKLSCGLIKGKIYQGKGSFRMFKIRILGPVSKTLVKAEIYSAPNAIGVGERSEWHIDNIDFVKK